MFPATQASAAIFFAVTPDAWTWSTNGSHFTIVTVTNTTSTTFPAGTQFILKNSLNTVLSAVTFSPITTLLNPIAGPVGVTANGACNVSSGHIGEIDCPGKLTTPFLPNQSFQAKYFFHSVPKILYLFYL